jgi:hypothetical protein
MLSALRVVNEKFGGVENYMIEKCGLAKEQIERIRANLTVEKPAIHAKA